MNELVEEKLITLCSMNRTRKMNVTNRMKELLVTSIFTSTSETNNWF